MILSVNLIEPSFPVDRLYAGAVRAFLFGMWVDFLGTVPTLTDVAEFGASVGRFEAEVDFGVLPVAQKSFVIANVVCRPNSVVIAVQSGNPGAGKVADEVEMDNVIYIARAGSGSFALFARTLDGPVAGTFKVAYSLS